MEKVIVISAHPDDELLGVGGTLLRHAANGDEIYWLIATNIFAHQGFSEARINSRHAEIDLVSKEVGFKNVFKLDFPTTSLTDGDLPSLVKKIGDVFQEVKPEIIYTLNRSDAHSDHRVLSAAVMACTKSFRYPFIRTILMYECISETEFAPAFPENVFIPNYYVDITDYLERKISLLKIYESEIGEHPFPRSIENVKALSTFRGATAGVKFAEAFQLVKCIIK